MENGWHSINLIFDDSQLWWKNTADAQWRLNFNHGLLQTEEDCPYGVSSLGIVLAQDSQGNYLSEVIGLLFSGELYERQPLGE